MNIGMFPIISKIMGKFLKLNLTSIEIVVLLFKAFWTLDSKFVQLCCNLYLSESATDHV